MMKLNEIILGHLTKSHEFILLDLEGKVISNTETLFESTVTEGSSIENLALFLSVYIYEASKLPVGESITLDCVRSDLMGRYGVFDIIISKVESEGQEMVLLDMEDRTEYYEKQQDVHQKRTEMMIEQEEIIQQAATIKKQNEEIRNLLKETHHRIKNNLQVVSSLIRFQSREVNDPKVAALFTDIQDRVHSIALLHEKLYRSSNLKNINIQDYIDSLVDELIKTYSVGKKISYNVTAKDVDVDTKTLVSIGLIINELVSNSLKHGLKDRSEGTIRVELENLEDNRFRLTVADDGVGISKKFLNEKPETVGGELIQLFTKQLNGKVEVLNESGAVVRIEFDRIDNFL